MSNQTPAVEGEVKETTEVKEPKRKKSSKKEKKRPDIHTGPFLTL